MSRQMRLIPYKDSDFKPVERVPHFTSSKTPRTSGLHQVMPISEQHGVEDEYIFVCNQRDSDSDDSFAEENSTTPIIQVMEQKPVERGFINYALYGNCFKGDECKNVQGHNEAVINVVINSSIHQ